jgi:serine/threonine-protein kinase RsbW
MLENRRKKVTLGSSRCKAESQRPGMEAPVSAIDAIGVFQRKTVLSRVAVRAVHSDPPFSATVKGHCSRMQRDFKKSIASLADVFAFIDELMSAQMVSPADSYAVLLAVEELFTNMVKYGTGSNSDISLDFEFYSRALVVRLVDHDVDPFDPRDAGKIDDSVPLSERRIGGLGIHLVRNMVDDLQYTYADRCSTITIIKNLER